MIPKHPGRAIVVITVLVIWGLITHGTFAGSGDEPHYLIISHSLAFDGDLDLANNYRDARLITGEEPLEPELHARLHDGRLRPVHDIGMPLVFAPAVRVAYTAAERLGGMLPPSLLRATRLNDGLLFRHQISLMMALVAGWLARELFLIFRELSGAARPAFWWALLFVLSPPILSHAFLFFTEVPSALLAIVVFRRLAIHPVQHTGAAALLGALAGALLLIHARNIGLVVGLGMLVVLGWRRRTIPPVACAAFIAGVSLGAVGRTVATYVLWGTFITTPHAALGTIGSPGALVYEVFVRMTGLLFDREYGLIGYAPIYLLAIAGLFLVTGRRPRLAVDLLVVIAAYLLPILLPNINVHGWSGGWTPAARFLVPIAPLLAIAAYMYVRAAPRPLVLALAALQVGISAFVWQYPKTLWNDGDGVSVFRLTAWLPSWMDPGRHEPLLFLAAACSALLFGYACARLARHPHPEEVARLST